MSKYAGHGRWEQHVEHEVQLDTDIAEAHAVVPMVEVVVRPDDGIQGQIEVGVYRCRGHGGHGEVPMLPVLMYCRHVDDANDDSEARHDDGCWIWLVHEDVVSGLHLGGGVDSVQCLLADSVDQEVGYVGWWC